MAGADGPPTKGKFPLSRPSLIPKPKASSLSQAPLSSHLRQVLSLSPLSLATSLSRLSLATQGNFAPSALSRPPRQVRRHAASTYCHLHLLTATSTRHAASTYCHLLTGLLHLLTATRHVRRHASMLHLLTATRHADSTYCHLHST